MLLNDEQMDRASGYNDLRVDLISFVVNEKHPVLGPLAKDILQIPEKPKTSDSSYIGIAPIALICFGLLDKRKRRKMAPWLGLLLVFLVLSLGSTLSINGTAYENIKLPKHFLNLLLPSVFAAFYRPDFFMSGAWLPLAVLSCFGLAKLLHRTPLIWRSQFTLVFIVIIAFEYYSPIPELAKPELAAFTTEERLAFLDWLESEPQGDISVINLPFGKFNSWRYSWFQSLSGYPQVEGYLSRVPGSAYGYIRANFLLNAWHNHRPIHCEMTDKEYFLAGLAKLEADGFSHVVYHHDLHMAGAVSESFRNLTPAYQDQFVSIYRLGDLRAGCPEETGVRHLFARVYADLLHNVPILDERHAPLILFPPTPKASDHFMRYLRHFDDINQSVIAVSSSAQGHVDVWNTESTDLERQNAVWVLRDQQGLASEQASAGYAWFSERFKYCEHIFEDTTIVIDIYIQLDIPCTAVTGASAIEVHYKDGVRLHNASQEVNRNRVRFYLAWTNKTTIDYSFSIQFIGADGQKVWQQDHVIQRELLTDIKIDTSQLPEGPYAVNLIVYDFETKVSQSGALVDGSHRFERELEIARIEI